MLYFINFYFSPFPICSLWKQEGGVVGSGPIALHFIVELLAMNLVWLVICEHVNVVTNILKCRFVLKFTFSFLWGSSGQIGTRIQVFLE